MDTDLILSLLSDALFAAVAASGFAVISTPPIRAVALSALLAAFGHAFRFYILEQGFLTTVPATFCAAGLIGLLSIFIARKSHYPIEVFSFPALLPMIPGIPAYETVLSLFRFMHSQDPVMKAQLLVDIFSNGLQMIFVLLALVVGACLPMFLFLTPLFQRKTPRNEVQPHTPPIGHVEFTAKTKLHRLDYDHFQQ